MPSTFSSSHPQLLVYFGKRGLDTLERFERVVLQPAHYSSEELGRLREAGTRPLAYLSLGEDTGAEAPWQRPERNPEWGGRYVEVGHPGWRRYVLARAAEALQQGFTGFFLDTLDLPLGRPEDPPALLALVAELRALVDEHGAGGYLIANRGFALHRELAEHVDAFLFETFSTTWEDGYRVLPTRALLENVMWLSALQATGRDVFCLDYADRQQLAAFARSRAATHGIPLQVTNREVTWLPAAGPTPGS